MNCSLSLQQAAICRFSARILSVGVLLLTSLLGAPQAYSQQTPRIGYMEKAEFPDKTYVLLNHAEEKYDVNRISAKGLRNLLDFSKRSGYPKIGIVNDLLAENPQLYTSQDVDHSISSVNGAHSALFPNAKEFLLAGGYATQCLAQALISTIGGMNFRAQPIKLILVTDAIFESASPLELKRLNELQVPVASTIYTLDAYITGLFRNAPKAAAEKELKTWLEQMLLKPHQMVAYLNRIHQWEKTESIDLRLFLGGKLLGHLSQGNRKVDIILKRSNELARAR